MNEIFNMSDTKVLYFCLIVLSFISFLIISIIKRFFKKVVKLIKDEKKSYTAFNVTRVILNVIYIFILLYLWGNQIQDLITLISFLSAGFTIAIRDIILNWFCGMFIKISKPFKVEDRIEINGVRGDVIGLSTLSFEVLEVSDKEENGQSTGIVINFPNSFVFSAPIKNLTKGFKYIWNELKINVNISGDLSKNKQAIYKIINSIDIVKNIPRKMKNQINEVNTTYRIYYNNYEPIIYTKIEGNHIVLSLRYLIHPKKARYVESVIWNKIYEAYKNGEIDLYIEE